jgi:hypothetical protein
MHWMLLISNLPINAACPALITSEIASDKCNFLFINPVIYAVPKGKDKLGMTPQRLTCKLSNGGIAVGPKTRPNDTSFAFERRGQFALSATQAETSDVNHLEHKSTFCRSG